MAKKVARNKFPNLKNYHIFSIFVIPVAALAYLQFDSRSDTKTYASSRDQTQNVPSSDSIEDYSQYDSSICLLDLEKCAGIESYLRSVIDCFVAENVNVYYLHNETCNRCELNPALVFPTTVEEVSKIVTCLSTANPAVEFRVRSGAHSFSGTSFVEKGVIVDMKRFRRISVKPKKQQVTLGVGIRVGEAFQALEKYNLLLVGGDCPDVGIGGLSSTGGTGFTSRKFGIMINHVLNYEVVLASGQIVNASFNENRDLFDVLRGTGASSFGITTHVTFKVKKLEPTYGFLRLQIDKNSMAEWLHYFLPLAKTLTPDFMYVYTYLFPDQVLVQGALTGDSFSNQTRQEELFAALIDGAKQASVSFYDAKMYRIEYKDLYRYTYGQEAYPTAISKKSTWMRDFREKHNSASTGIMSGYVCADNLPLEILEQLEKHYYYAKHKKDMHDGDIGTNIEHFGGQDFPDKKFGVYQGKNCGAIITTYPKNVDHKKRRHLIKDFQQEFWKIVRPHTNYSYRGYEDMSHGRTDEGKHREMMDFYFGEEARYEVMKVKSKYDPDNLFKHHLSIPTLDCYEKNICGTEDKEL